MYNGHDVFERNGILFSHKVENYPVEKRPDD